MFGRSRLLCVRETRAASRKRQVNNPTRCMCACMPDPAGARSPLSSVMLILGLVCSCGVFALLRSNQRPSSIPSAPWLESQGPGDVGGDEGVLAREGVSWKLPHVVGRTSETQLTGRYATCERGGG